MVSGHTVQGGDARGYFCLPPPHTHSLELLQPPFPYSCPCNLKCIIKRTKIFHDFFFPYNLFLGEPCASEEVDCLLVTKVNVITEQKNEEKFTDILLLLVAVQSVI